MNEFDRLSIIGILAMEEIPADVLQFLEDYLTAPTKRERIRLLADELTVLQFPEPVGPDSAARAWEKKWRITSYEGTSISPARTA